MKTQPMETDLLNKSTPLWKWASLSGVVLVVLVIAFVSRGMWLPRAKTILSPPTKLNPRATPAGHEDHAGHDHEHAGHDEATSLDLSLQAKKNVGLETTVVKLETFVRTASFPAIVIGRPGRAEMEVTAPLGGRVMQVYAFEGDAVEPGQPLFKLRLTHEELVKAQSELLSSAEQLAVEEREINRLQSIVDTGAIPGKRLLEREYEKQKIEAVINAQRQTLLLHGLSQEQIDGILTNRKLVQDMTVVTPDHEHHDNKEENHHPFTVRALGVEQGQYVDAGATLCHLMDYELLYVQGRAFEQDAEELQQAAKEGWNISAALETGGGKSKRIDGLKITYVENQIDPESRSLLFYVALPNEIVNERDTEDGHKFLTWRYKPGQRMQLKVPTEEWEKRIVLPVDAVAKEGVEYYVFQQNGDHFDRVPVHVEYTDQFFAVIANDGSIFPGDTVAISGAHQLQMALKNKAGGGVDPHAGHNH